MLMESPPRPAPRTAADEDSDADPDTSMHIDLSTLPPLVEPSPPSNTLLITNLHNPAIFATASLRAVRAYMEAECGPLYSFSPLKSFRRIVVTFYSTESAVALRRGIDGTSLLGCRARCFFGADTPTDAGMRHLQAPQADKQFFISPPPSPPHGWTMRNEDPPNKEVHAADLAGALETLEKKRMGGGAPPPDVDMRDPGDGQSAQWGHSGAAHRRTSSTVVFQPDGGAGLPAVMVEDTSENEVQVENERRILEHTARPPVELME